MYTGKFIGVFSTAFPVLLPVVSFEVVLLGAMVTVVAGKKCSTNVVHME